MIILIFLHMGRTFFFGAYKYPRELNWVIGVVLLILTLIMGFTGYLLPFDQRSFWATIVGVNINGTGPFVGPYLADFLRAGPEFGADDAVALLRDPHAARPGADHRPDRRPPLPGRQARHDGAAVACAAESQAEGPLAARSAYEAAPRRSSTSASTRSLKKKGKPFFPYAVLKDSAMTLIVVLRDRGDVAHARRRAGPEGRPDDDQLRAAAGVVLLLPLRAAAGDQAARSSSRWRRSGSRRSAWSCCSCCRSTTATPSAAPSAGRSRPPPGVMTIVAMAYLTFLGADRRLADRDRPPGAARSSRPARRSPPQSGCLACHKFGDNGNDGPGPT